MNLPQHNASRQASAEKERRVLLADDDEMVLEVLHSFLDQLGYQVSEARDGREALRIFRQGAVDLVLSDVKMPGLDGLQLLKAIKDSNPRLPVILISGYGDMETVIEAINSGAHNFLQKPVRLAELSQVLQRLQRMEAIARPTGELLPTTSQVTQFEIPSKPEYGTELVYQLSKSAVTVGFAQDDLKSNLKLAIIEGLNNAMEHGNRWQRDRKVWVEASVQRDKLQVSIRDQGPGFDHSALPDPTDTLNLTAERGRGVFLIRAIMDRVTFNRAGNQITMIKYKDPESREQTV